MSLWIPTTLLALYAAERLYSTRKATIALCGSVGISSKGFRAQHFQFKGYSFIVSQGLSLVPLYPIAEGTVDVMGISDTLGLADKVALQERLNAFLRTLNVDAEVSFPAPATVRIGNMSWQELRQHFTGICEGAIAALEARHVA